MVKVFKFVSEGKRFFDFDSGTKKDFEIILKIFIKQLGCKIITIDDGNRKHKKYKDMFGMWSKLVKDEICFDLIYDEDDGICIAADVDKVCEDTDCDKLELIVNSLVDIINQRISKTNKT